MIEVLREIVKKPENFIILYSEEDNEVVVHQTVSTRPIFVFYYKLSPEDDKDEILKRVETVTRCRKFSVTRIEWDLEKAVGVKIAVE
jgi:hypothetical protein